MVKDAIRSVDVAARRIEVDGEFLDLPARRAAARKPRPSRRAAQGGGGGRSGSGAGGGDGHGD